MRRKIALALLVVFACSASGAAVAAMYIRDTTGELRRLIDLHRIEDLRQQLIISVQAAQSDVYTARTSLGQQADVISDNVLRLREAATACSGCHHAPVVARRLDRVGELLDEYEAALSYYITASANRERIARLQIQAAAVGNELLRLTEEMSFEAGDRLEARTAGAMEQIDRARFVLYGSLLASFVLSIVAALHLMTSVTRPIGELVRATRALAAGDLGITIPGADRTEFGELAAHFNAMSGALRDGYAALQAQVQERELAEEALRKSEERYALAARGANDGLWDWDLGRDRVYFSLRWKSMLGHSDAEIGDRPADWLDRVHLEDAERVRAEIAAHLDGAVPHFESEYRIRHADGTWLWVMCRGVAVRDEAGRAYRFAGSQTDITARKQAEQQLLHDAFHDALTGLANRALFTNRLEQVLRSVRRRPGTAYAVLFLDLDRFKVVNDSLGHLVGDQLLVGVAERLARCVRPSDTIARLGGDEFAILLTDVRDVGDAIAVVDRIQAALAERFAVDGHELFAAASIGIAGGVERYERAEQVLRDADVAMYQAKSKGRGRYEIFDAEMHGGVVARLALESDLRLAVADGEQFLLHYQPIVDLRDGRLVGVEALIRWNKPKRGLVGPSEFIPLAEEAGMIASIGDWTMRAACRQLREWKDLQPALQDLRMSLNVSSRQFRDPDVVDRLARILRESGVEPHHVVVELTESAIMEDVEATAAKLTVLRDMGIDVHVDDFGTGYSSLSYLHRFPISAVKIDRSFVEGLPKHGESEEVIRAIVSLAESLGFEVIAEGVERMDQLVRLRELRCGFAQGFLFARPMPPEDIAAANAPQAAAAGDDA